MFRFLPRFVAVMTLASVILFALFMVLGFGRPVSIDILVFIYRWPPIVLAGICTVLIPATHPHRDRELLRQVIAICAGAIFIGLTIGTPTLLLEMDKRIFYLSVLGVAVAFGMMLAVPEDDVPVALNVPFVAALSVATLGSVGVWVIALGPLWDAQPLVGWLAALSVGLLAFAGVVGVQHFGPIVVRERASSI